MAKNENLGRHEILPPEVRLARRLVVLIQHQHAAVNKRLIVYWIGQLHWNAAGILKTPAR